MLSKEKLRKAVKIAKRSAMKRRAYEAAVNSLEGCIYEAPEKPIKVSQRTAGIVARLFGLPKHAR